MKKTRQPREIIYISRDFSSNSRGGIPVVYGELGSDLFQLPLISGSVALVILVGSIGGGDGGGGGGGAAVGLSVMNSVYYVKWEAKHVTSPVALLTPPKVILVVVQF
jgi:hypothetical protein